MDRQLTKNAKSQFIEKLEDWKYREAYVRASINVNLPSQIRALRLRQGMTQKDLADASKMLQPRISAMEKPGAVKFNVETLVRVAAGLGVGLIVKFVSISEMLAWENGFCQDEFNAARFDHDLALAPDGSIACYGCYHSVSSTPASDSGYNSFHALP
jgi:transcriptional regulator with XRE-family HTH domain